MSLEKTYKQRVFIFDHREIIVISALVGTAIVFAFTLGVHLTKQIKVESGNLKDAQAKTLETSADQVPNQVDLVDQKPKANESAEGTLQKSLQTEVKKSGIKIKQGFEVELPTTTKTRAAGATTLHDSKETSQ